MPTINRANKACEPAHGICHADLPNQRPQLASVSARHEEHPALSFVIPLTHPSRRTVFTTFHPSTLVLLLHTKRNLLTGALAIESRDGSSGEPIALPRLAKNVYDRNHPRCPPARQGSYFRGKPLLPTLMLVCTCMYAYARLLSQGTLLPCPARTLSPFVLSAPPLRAAEVRPRDQSARPAAVHVAPATCRVVLLPYDEGARQRKTNRAGLC